MEQELYLKLLIITCLSLALLGFSIGSFSSNIYGKYVPIGGSGGGLPSTGNGQLNHARGIAIDSLGHLYVADTDNNRIQRFNEMGSFMTKWGGPQPGIQLGKFDGPLGIAVDSQGAVYVADTNNHRIQKFIFTSTCPSVTIQIVSGVCIVKSFGLHSSAIGNFSYPAGIAVDSKDDVYVADTSNNRIQKFRLTSPCPSGTTEVWFDVCHVVTWGGWGSGDGEFNRPMDIAVDSKDDVYVADTSNNRIQKFHMANACPSGNKQVVPGVCFVTKWGGPQPGIVIGQFSYPQGVDVDASGNVFVADTGNTRIQKIIQRFPPAGTTVIVPFPTVWGSQGSGYNQFMWPTNVADFAGSEICSVDIAWYNGNARVYHFDIATSWDGSTFSNKFSGDSSGTTLNPEKYIIPVTKAKYIRITVNGNTVNNWASITELHVFGSFSFGSCSTKLSLTDATASGNDGNVPQNILDGSLSTRWSSQGLGQYITTNLDSDNMFVLVADSGNNVIQEFIDDTTAPTVSISSPINGATLKYIPPHTICITCPTLNVPSPINPAENLEMTVTASDNVKVAQVQFFASDINGYNTLLGTDTSSPYSFPLTDLLPDTYTLTAKAYDTADNTQISTGITVKVVK